MVATSIKRYNRCRWMAIVSLVFIVMTIGFIIPGIIGVAGLNRYNDTLLYLALIDLVFAGIFFTGWITCQIECEDIEETIRHISRPPQNKYGSIASHGSSTSSCSSHQPMKVSTVNEVSHLS